MPKAGHIAQRQPLTNSAQSWSFICCIIEVVVETITVGIYGVIFYRYYSKHQLHKAMDARDKARSDLVFQPSNFTQVDNNVLVACGEPIYEAVPIPGTYAHAPGCI